MADTVIINEDKTEISITTEVSAAVISDVGSQGPPGVAGAQGPQGSVYNPLGEWDNSTNYIVNDLVTYDGSSYVCIAINHSGQPDQHPELWMLLAEKGEQGEGIPTGGTAGQLLAKVDGTDYNSEWIDPPISTGTANRFAKFDNGGQLSAIESLTITEDEYLQRNFTAQPDGETGGFEVDRYNVYIDPLQDSPDQTWNIFSTQVSLDSNDSGHDIGTNGRSVSFYNMNLNHNGTSDIGAFDFFNCSFSVGNGTDPIELKGMGYNFGFGQVQDNVTISGPLQGYGFQLNVSPNAEFTVNNTYIQAFYDNANIGCVSQGYNSFNASPNIEEVASNRNYNGLTVSPNINTFQSGSGFIGVGITGNYGTFGNNSYFQGVNINPNIDSARYAAGLNVSMDNVTPYPGVKASLVIQDLTIEADVPGQNYNSVAVIFQDTVTAGNETAVFNNPNLIVSIESGVSTATQVAAALNAQIGFTSNFSVTISGTGSNPQVAQSATNLTGGVDAGRVLAAYLDGDVEITGALSFQGNISIGRLQAFSPFTLVDGGGAPASVHQLITQPTIGPNLNVANADLLGVNTAMLLSIGDNSNVTSTFLGLTALGLPAVVSMGSGSTIDQVSGATFAISLDAAAAGGTITSVDLCRTLALPNGTTTVSRLAAYKFDLPFGSIATTTWGVYITPTANNFMAGNLKIGGADIVGNSDVGLEVEGKFMVLGRGTTAARDGKTPFDGAMWYNTSLNKFQGFANGSWVDFH